MSFLTAIISGAASLIPIGFRARHSGAALACACMLQAGAQTFSVNPVQTEVLVSPGFNPLPMAVYVLSNAAPGFDMANLSVTSDSPWVTPRVDVPGRSIILTFATSNLVSLSHTATLVARHGSVTNEFFVSARMNPLNVTKLLDDPVRSRIYGIDAQGVGRGNLLVIDPMTGVGIGSLTVGRKPTDLAITPDGEELFVINALDKTISVIAPGTLTVKETIQLTEYTNWGENDTTANIQAGPPGIIYYTDGAWAPVLRVYDRNTRTVRQSVLAGENGVGDFALSKDFGTLIAWAQYGWSAGWAGSYAVRFSVNGSGQLALVEQTLGQSPTQMARDPLDTPVLINSSGSVAFVKQYLFNTGGLNPPQGSLSAPAYSITPGGEVAGTAGGLYEVRTGNKLHNLPGNITVQAFTSDYARFVYFDPTTGAIRSLNTAEILPESALNRQFWPPNKSIVLPPTQLMWPPMEGVDRFHVYFGTNQTLVADAAGTNSAAFLGTANGARMAVNTLWTHKAEYYWRIDPIYPEGPEKGDVRAFRVSPISASTNIITVTTVQGHRNQRASLNLHSPEGLPWKARTETPWITFVKSEGVTLATLELVIDASQLSPGVHMGSITVSDGINDLFDIPVHAKVEGLKLTLLESDPASELVYGISEPASAEVGQTLLLEINTRTEGIERLVPVGTSVTDLAVHNGDDRIYVPNWMGGSLLAIDKQTLQLERTFAFGTGYGGGDVYKVAAAGPGRLVVEEKDQWISIFLFDTINGTNVASTGVREGGGSTTQGGRYYYHGDNNNSGAEIHKFDLTGDVIKSLAHVRVDYVSYYGDRLLVASEDGQRIFWNGAVFNKDLALEWDIRDRIYATTPDGRYAFGADKVYDVMRRRAVMGMPASTQVSAFNSTSRKLVTQVGGALRFYPLADPPSLAKPVLSAAERSSTSITLQWLDRSLETSFTVQTRLSGETNWLGRSVPQNTNRHVFAQLSPETTYEFRVKAEADGISSEWSEILTAMTPGNAPAPAVLSLGQVTPTAVQLLLSNVTTSGSYMLTRRVVPATGTSAFENYFALPTGTTSVEDTNVTPGVTYEYQVSATNKWGVALSQVRSVKVPPPSPPSAPIGLAARSTGFGSVELSWAATADTLGYKIDRRTENSNSWTRVAIVQPRAQQIFLDTNVLTGTEYWYRVAAFNLVGDSAFSAQASVIVNLANTNCLASDSFDPELNLGLWAEILGGVVLRGSNGFASGNALWFGTNTTRSAITVPLPLAPGTTINFKLRAGNEVLDGGEHWNNSEAGEGVVLEYATDSFAWTTIQSFDTSFPRLSGWTNLSVSIPAGAASARTQLRWRQTKHSGAGYDTWAIDDVCVQAPAPSWMMAPTFIISSANSSTSASVLWIGTPAASFYVVERRVEAGSWKQVALVPTSYWTDTGLLPQTTYAYRVKAATLSSQSPYSPTTLVTTMTQAADWLLANAGSTNAPLTSLGANDVPNILRYAYNISSNEPLDPLTDDSNKGIPLLWYDAERKRLCAEFVRRKPEHAPGIDYSFQVSEDLTHWVAVPSPASTISVDDIWERVIFEASPGGASAKFSRVVVSLQ